MLTYVLAGLAAIVIASYALRAYLRASPRALARWLLPAAGVGALIAAAYLGIRGALGSALGLAMTGLWLLSGAGTAGWGGWPRWPSGSPQRGQQTSRVETEHLEMELDHDSGEMRGGITKGFFKGRTMQSLKPVELAHLWQDCRFADPQSAQLVEAYLDRVHPTWREDLARAEATAPKGPDGRMTRAEALEILGLKDGASADDIRRAHRQLMQRMHPDRGGSTYLAAKINEAKDVALGE